MERKTRKFKRLMDELQPRDVGEFRQWCDEATRFLEGEILGSADPFVPALALVKRASMHAARLGGTALSRETDFRFADLARDFVGRLSRCMAWCEEQSKLSKPFWNRDEGELVFKGEVIKTIRRIGVAKNVVCVLDSFQELNWPPRIDDPLGSRKDFQRLHNTVKSLNTELTAIRFHADGEGRGFCWSPR